MNSVVTTIRKVPVQLIVEVETICPLDQTVDKNIIEIRFIQSKKHFVELIELNKVIDEYRGIEIYHEELIYQMFNYIKKKFNPVQLKIFLSSIFKTLSNMEFKTYIETSYKNQRTPCKCEFCWKFKKEPRLGKNHLSLVEALADSAQQLLINDNLDGVYDRINRIITLTRKIINSYPENLDQARCRYRVTKRMRCNLPLIGKSCVDHGVRGFNADLEDWI